MPDDVIHLLLPAAPEFGAVASVAVRAAARQVALPETEIRRLRAALDAAFEARLARADASPITVDLHPSPGSLRVVLDGTDVG
jgi:hypothetical protein